MIHKPYTQNPKPVLSPKPPVRGERPAGLFLRRSAIELLMKDLYLISTKMHEAITIERFTL